MNDILATFKSLVKRLEFLEHIINSLTSVRLIHESDKDTFDRVLKLAYTTICKNCRGYGYTISGPMCKDCNGIGSFHRQ